LVLLIQLIDQYHKTLLSIFHHQLNNFSFQMERDYSEIIGKSLENVTLQSNDRILITRRREGVQKNSRMISGQFQMA
jgi:hypothetical protein